MKLITGDKVKVLSGKYKGKTGKVLQVFPKMGTASVEGINLRQKHLKAQGKNQGQKVEFPAPLHTSKLMLIDSKSGKPTRVGYKVVVDGGKSTKVRIAKATGEVIA